MEVLIRNKKGIVIAQAMIDDEDFSIFSQRKGWSLNSKSGYLYCRSGYLHRFIMQAKKGQVVDHINGNLLDNRKENLRLCSVVQNIQNQKKPTVNTSGYKGVNYSKCNKTWRAVIGYHYKKVCIFQSENKELLARMYDAGARVLYGEFARLNFPNEPLIELPVSVLEKLLKVKTSVGALVFVE